MFDWLIRKLPKRVIKMDNLYYPQVWFLWWHFIWSDASEFAYRLYNYTQEDAVFTLKYRWKKREMTNKTVVWRSSKDDRFNEASITSIRGD